MHYNGDEIADDNFWTKIITFPIYTASPLRYQYGANWGLESNGGENLNETGYGVYHSTFFKSNFWYGEIEDKFGIIEHKNIVNGIEQIGSEIPSAYELKQNYPNPFNPTTIINFSIPESGLVTLKVFNILGEEVAELVNDVKSAGSYEVSFDATSALGGLTSGIYIYRIKIRNYTAAKKMLLLK
ncbi:MAG: T9SS type A sorting domain-containing protein [Melioribacteraceae bacterium]|nr:T9SS type A sorting domain-containing protein [Melioribacteraceae bacterium]